MDVDGGAVVREVATGVVTVDGANCDRGWGGCRGDVGGIDLGTVSYVDVQVIDASIV